MGHGLHDSDTIYSVETLGIVLNQKQQIAIFDRREYDSLGMVTHSRDQIRTARNE